MIRLALPLLLGLLAPLHTRLVRSEPVVHSTVATAPTELRLWFDGGIEAAFTQVSLHSSGGARLAVGAPVRGDDPRFDLLIVPIPMTLAPDSYTVRWRTVGRDGHPIEGEFGFAVAGADSAAPPPPAAIDSSAWGAGAAGRTVVGERVVDVAHPHALDTGSPAQFSSGMRPVRWAELTALATALGAIAMLLFVLRTAPGSPAHERFLAAAVRRVRTAGIVAAVLALALALARFAIESSVMHAGSAGIAPDELARTAATAWGRAWLVGTIATAGLLLALLLRRRADRAEELHRPSVGSDLALGAAALVAAVGPALTGHAAVSAALMPLAVFADWLHVVGASAWIGGVILLAVAGAPAALAQLPEERSPALAWLVSAFHALATPAIVLVGASGVLSAWLRVGSWEALTRTNYGDLLLFKVYVVAFAALMGAYHWLRVHPRLLAAAAGHDRDARQMRWTLYVELVAGFLVLALTAALVTTPPPR